jgi:hypothetical protein
MFPSAKAFYLLLDFPKGGKLRETGLSQCIDKQGNRFIEEEEL